MNVRFRRFCPKSGLSGYDNIEVLANHAAIDKLLVMKNECAQELALLLERFVSGADTTLAAANRLEVLLEELFPNDELVQERVVDLAMYRPGGGDFLFDEMEMRNRLDRLRNYLAL